jgi:hypothetical protein
MAKKVYVTYCSAEKQPIEKEIKAIDRYVSERIAFVHALAKQDNADFMILSGKFGLLAPTDLIPNYDHLMKAFETTRMSKTIAKQLKLLRCNSIVYYTHWMDKDVHVAPYIESIHDACEMTNTGFDLVVFEDDVAV